MTSINATNPINLYETLSRDFSAVSQLNLADPDLLKVAVDSIKRYTEQIKAILDSPQINNKYKYLFLGLDADINTYKSQVIQILKADANPTIQSTQWLAELNLLSTASPEKRYSIVRPISTSSSSSSSSSSAINQVSGDSIEDRRSSFIEFGKALEKISSARVIRTISDEFEFYTTLLNTPSFIHSLPSEFIVLTLNSPLIPEEIEILKNTKGLSLTANQATKLPQSFSKLTSLTTLSLNCLRLEKLPQDFFSAHPALVSITLRCPLALNDRDSMPKLEYDNSIITDVTLGYDSSNPLPQFLAFCNLDRLVIEGFQPPDKHMVLHHFLYSIDLKALELIDTNIKFIPKWIDRFETLQTLVISGINGVKDLPDEILKLNLTNLDISENQLNPHGLSVLDGLRSKNVTINHEGEEPDSEYMSESESTSEYESGGDNDDDRENKNVK